jgi:hypothetical protein
MNMSGSHGVSHNTRPAQSLTPNKKIENKQLNSNKDLHNPKLYGKNPPITIFKDSNNNINTKLKSDTFINKFINASNK